MIAALRNRSAVQHVKRLKLPVVDVSRTMRKEEWFVRVTTDDRARAELAVDHFRSRCIEHFACYAPAIGRYSDHRSREFQAALEARGLQCDHFPATVDGQSWLANYNAVGDWLESLPKPLGIFAGDPYPARQLVEICSLRSIRIPDEVAILAGDDDELLCNVAAPRISSIELASRAIGDTAAKILQQLFNGEAVDSPVTEIKPLGIRSRESTDLMAIVDPEMRIALRFIRDHAVKGINVTNVAQACCLSRRTIENRFREQLDRTPAGEIRRVKLEQVRRSLIDTDRSIEQIAFDCGFANGASLAQAYKKSFGESPGQTRSMSK